MRIQHNIMAMNAYRNYNTNNKALSGNLEKLSSGYKINRAGDDAAGLAISEKMRAQITGLEAAQKNVKDGISLVKTAEGAMQEIQDMLNRMDYLATQSANGTYQDAVDREALQAEVNQLRTEINRIADSANFNGIKLLDGSLDVGQEKVSLTGASEVITDNAQVLADGQLAGKEPAAGKYSIDFSQSTIRNDTKNSVNFVYHLSDDGAVVLNNIAVGAGESLSGEELANAVKTAIEGHAKYNSTDGTLAILDPDTGKNINFNVSVEGSKLILEMTEPPETPFTTKLDGKFENMFDGDVLLTVTGEQTQVTPEIEAVSKTARAYGQAEFDLADFDIQDGSAIKIGDETYVFALGADSKYKNVANVIDLTDLKEVSDDNVNIAAQRLAQAAKDNKALYVGSNLSDGVITLTEKEGGVDYTKNNLAGADGMAELNGSKGQQDATAKDWAGLVQFGTAKVDKTASGTALNLQIGDTSDSFNQMKIEVGDMHTKAMGTEGGKSIADIDIGTSEGAQEAVNVIKDAINYVSSVRGNLGAYQNRLEHTQNNLSVMAENIQDAESTIRDTDVAEEMMSYVKNNILVQSAQAMLAQANQVPQGVLQLLG